MTPQESAEFWKYIEDNYREVAEWPRWMRGDVATPHMEFYPPAESAQKGKP